MLLCVLAVLLPVKAASITNGAGNGHIYWELTEDGTLFVYEQRAFTYPWSGYGQQIKKIVISDGVQTISYNAFRNMVNVTEVQLPTTLKTIEQGAFQGCTRMKTIVIPEGVTEIGIDAFDGCEKLEGIVLPAGLVKLGENAFSGCKTLK